MRGTEENATPKFFRKLFGWLIRLREGNVRSAARFLHSVAQRAKQHARKSRATAAGMTEKRAASDPAATNGKENCGNN